MISASSIELSESAYFNNLDLIEKWAGKKSTIFLVVKGNAYGHGINQIVPMAMKYGISKFAVFNYSEAIEVENASDGKAEIMVMGYIAENDYCEAIQKEISFFVFNHIQLNQVLIAAETINKAAKIHLEFNTGMNRSGFDPSIARQLFELVKANPQYIQLTGICSHLAGAESIANYVRIKNQVKVFRSIEKLSKTMNVLPQYFHLACSAAMVRFPSIRYDLVRVGIIQYGLWPSMEVFIEYLNKKKTTADPLKRIISWKTKIMDIQQIKSGQYIGYGNSFLANKNIKSAVLPIGYSHGYSRVLSNSGNVIVNNMKVKVIGTINMNATTIDVTDVPQINIGDNVYLIGGEGDLQISISSFAEMSDQLNYELLTRLPKDLPRTIIA
jgi:alanine racemase